MIPLNEPAKQPAFALFNLGFRVFFASAGLIALVSIILWVGIHQHGWQPLAITLPAMQWHAHEMIYGYALAVIAGFLLTAVRNWTSLTTPSGLHLALIFSTWAGARILPFLPLPNNLLLMAILDLLFLSWVIITITIPIVKARQQRQIAIVFCVFLLLASHTLFYLGVFQKVPNGITMGLYSGLYLVVGLILILGGRVIPFFIERGVGRPVTLKRYNPVEILSLVLFVVFWIVESFTQQQLLSASLAVVLFILHAIRLATWTVAGIWQKPLLWILWVGYAVIVAGFALKAASYFFGLSPFLAIHAFGYGGVGLITVGMMCRVALGHTGRNIHQAPKTVVVIFIALMVGVIARVAGPLVLPAFYNEWIISSSALWIIAFALFCLTYIPILVAPRADGQAG